MITRPLRRLEQVIQLGLLILVALMPFHAFFSIWLGHLVGHESIIQAWKEVLILVLAALTAMLLIKQPARLRRFRQPWVLLAAGFALVMILVTAATRPPLTAVAFGLKTDLEFLVAALIALAVSNKALVHKLQLVILVGAAVVTGFGLLQIFVLPADFLTHFGYGPGTILPYQTITAGTNSLRFGSTLGGPNQLGTYLILPIVLSLWLAVTRRRWWLLGLPLAASIVLIHTYSRGAWLGALAAAILTLLALVPRRYQIGLGLGLVVVAVVGALSLPALLRHGGSLQYYVLHSSAAAHGTVGSDAQHALSLKNGLSADLAVPLGHGLGTAGPATFHVGTGNIIEDYYLQIGYEAGVLGSLSFILLIVTVGMKLWRHAPPVAAAIVGVSLVGLVLPSWTDSTTSLVVWTFAGALTWKLEEV